MAAGHAPAAPPAGAGPSRAAADPAPPAPVSLDVGDRLSAAGWPLAAWITAVLVVAPVAFVATSVISPRGDVWRQQWETRLPGQLISTLVLLVGVSIGTLVVGGGLAWLTTAYRFPGTRWFDWALVAPLAMPSYVLGFVLLSVMGYSGPVQTAWRAVLGQEAWFPDVRSMGGAVLAFTLVFYPYVYLFTRAALHDQASGAYEAARTLGAGPSVAARRVVLPLLRPALAAGVAVVMMETLTDFATVNYFGVETVSVGVFRIWRGTFDRDAASELATMVLLFALAVIGIERLLRGRARYGQAAGQGNRLEPTRLTGVRAVSASAVCSLVLGLAFIAPTLHLVVGAIRETTGSRGTPLADRVLGYLEHSLILAAATAAVCVLV
ncbi:MAG: ABC transporter permease, partial [Acidimicrobiales bacterium]